MLKIARIFLLLLGVWIFINLGPTLLCCLPRRASFPEVALGLYSGRAWYWELVNEYGTLMEIYPYILPVRGLILLIALILWLRKPNIFRACLLIGVGPWIAPISLGPLAYIAALVSPCIVLGGYIAQIWWDDPRPTPDPSAPMPTWHH